MTKAVCNSLARWGELWRGNYLFSGKNPIHCLSNFFLSISMPRLLYDLPWCRLNVLSQCLVNAVLRALVAVHISVGKCESWNSNPSEGYVSKPRSRFFLCLQNHRHRMDRRSQFPFEMLSYFPIRTPRHPTSTHMKQKKGSFTRKSLTLIVHFQRVQKTKDPTTLKRFFPRANRRVWLVYRSYFYLLAQYKYQHLLTLDRKIRNASYLSRRHHGVG